MKLPKRQTGIALVQIILITSIMSVLALYLTTTAREQITISQWYSDKTQAYVKAKSAESLITFALLTEPLTNVIEQPSAESYYVADKWNLYSKTFNLTPFVRIKIQDQGGLLHANYPNPEFVTKFFAAQGLTEGQSRQLLDTLLDWQDIDTIARPTSIESEEYKNGPAAFVSEIALINEQYEHLMPMIKDNFTVHRSNNFNPLTASVELLSALSTSSVAKEVERLRNERLLTPRLFEQVTGIKEDDRMYFFPSKFFSISIISEVNESVVKKDIMLQIEPTAENIHPLDVKYRKS